MNDSKSIFFINPRLVFSSKDLFTTGIVYMPFLLAYLIASLKELKVKLKLTDCFGESPNTIEKKNNMYFRGRNLEDLDKSINEYPTIFAIYAINLSSHESVIEITQFIKKKYPKSKIIILENSQAVTAYSLKKVAKDFYAAGADYIATGDLEISAYYLIKKILNSDANEIENIPGVGFIRNSETFYNNQNEKIEDLDKLNFPAWEFFPLNNYWNLKYSHGPMETKKYLPLLTSRGCPYPCKFCVIVDTNNKKWRKRSPKNIINEMNYFFEKFNVHEFHIEDVDPTINDRRTKEFCNLLIENNKNYIWKICSGTKIESIKDEQTVELMAKAGCNYISVSPETGSKELLKKIDKPFDLKKLLILMKSMIEHKIYTQACFILGFPGESEKDILETKKLIKQLTIFGLDEIALFIISPVPGSEIYEKFVGYSSLSELNFSPVWRKDYKYLNKIRLKLYFLFIFYKFINHPKKVLTQSFRFLKRNFKTKMEMTPYRAMHLATMIFLYNLKK